jgi:hypothetical protein
MDDPGLTQISGAVIVPDLHDEDEEPICSVEGIGLSITGEPTPEITILRAEVVVLDLDLIQDPCETLDADSQELEAFGCLFDLEGGVGLHPDLEQMLEGFGRHVAIGERVRLAPAWRGLGGVGCYLFGRMLFGRMLPLICCDPIVVAAQPFPLDVTRDEKGNADKESLKHGLSQIRRTWRSIGFEPYEDDIWIMDPNSIKHERSIAKLERQLSLPKFAS